MLRVAIVYPFFAHYSEAILRKLSEQADSLQFVYVSGLETDADAPKTIPIEGRPGQHSLCGAAWYRVKNIWFLERFLWQRGLLSTIRTIRPDVVVSLGVAHHPCSWILALYCKARGIPLVLWTHGVYGNEGWLKSLLRERLHRLGDHIMTYGDVARNRLLASGFSGERVTAIHNC